MDDWSLEVAACLSIFFSWNCLAEPKLVINIHGQPRLSKRFVLHVVVDMKRGIEDPMRPTAAKVFRGWNCHTNAAGDAEDLSASGCERRKTSSDSDGSSGCLNISSSEVGALVHKAILEKEGKCRVCLWPIGSPQCYHWGYPWLRQAVGNAVVNCHMRPTYENDNIPYTQCLIYKRHPIRQKAYLWNK